MAAGPTFRTLGPNKLATKIAVGIVSHESAEPEVTRWHSATEIRDSVEIMEDVINFIKTREICSVALIDKIVGCPHEEGVDYSEGEFCPVCPYWVNRDRWTDDLLH